MFIKNNKFEIFGTCKVQMMVFWVAKTWNWLDGIARFGFVKVDVRDRLHCLGIPGMQRLIIIRDEGVYILIQKYVIDQNFVFIVNTETTTAEL
jgi:hypothetical protein